MKEKVTILVLTPTLECGGAEKYTATLCNNLPLDKYRIILVVVNNAAPFFKIRDEVKVIDLRLNRVLNIFPSLKNLLREYQPEIVFSTSNHTSLFAAITKRYYRHRCLWIARETSVVSSNSRHAKYPFVYRWLLRKFYRKLDLIICQNLSMAEDLIQHFNVPRGICEVIPPGIDVIVSANPEAPDLLTVARLSPEKGIDRILQALARIKIPFNYVVAGEGKEMNSLRQQAQGLSSADRTVHFVGAQADPVARYAGAKLMLCGSWYEGSPNAILEANVHGIPVVAFDVPGVSDVIVNGRNGFLVSDGDTEAFASAVSMALNYPFNREEISRAATNEYGLKKMINSTEAAILQLLNRRNG